MLNSVRGQACAEDSGGPLGDLSGTSEGPLGDVCGTSGGPPPWLSQAAPWRHPGSALAAHRQRPGSTPAAPLQHPSNPRQHHGGAPATPRQRRGSTGDHRGVKFCPRAGGSLGDIIVYNTGVLNSVLGQTCAEDSGGPVGDLSGTSEGPLGDVCGTPGGPQPRRSPAAATSGQACHRFVLNWDRRAEFCPRLLPLRDLCATSARPLQDLCATSARHCATSAGPLARPLRDLCATSGVVPPFV